MLLLLAIAAIKEVDIENLVSFFSEEDGFPTIADIEQHYGAQYPYDNILGDYDDENVEAKWQKALEKVKKDVENLLRRLRKVKV